MCSIRNRARLALLGGETPLCPPNLRVQCIERQEYGQQRKEHGSRLGVSEVYRLWPPSATCRELRAESTEPGESRVFPGGASGPESEAVLCAYAKRTANAVSMAINPDRPTSRLSIQSSPGSFRFLGGPLQLTFLTKELQFATGPRAFCLFPSGTLFHRTGQR